MSEQPHLIIPDIVQALHGHEPELQFAGLLMVDKVLQQEGNNSKESVYIDRNWIKSVIQNIRSLSLQGVEDKQLENLIREADAVYLRYSEH